MIAGMKKLEYKTGITESGGMPMEPETVDEIRENLAIVLGRKGGGLALQDALRRLDSYVESDRVTLDAHLQHYLKNRSYEKAFDYLESK